MCTSIAYTTKHFYFGRNLDLEYSFGEEVVITPRNYRFTYKKQEAAPAGYAMVGMANVVAEYPLYAEAVNEKGLGIAGLNFPGNAFRKRLPTPAIIRISVKGLIILKSPSD